MLTCVTQAFVGMLLVFCDVFFVSYRFVENVGFAGGYVLLHNRYCIYCIILVFLSLRSDYYNRFRR